MVSDDLDDAHLNKFLEVSNKPHPFETVNNTIVPETFKRLTFKRIAKYRDSLQTVRDVIPDLCSFESLFIYYIYMYLFLYTFLYIL